MAFTCDLTLVSQGLEAERKNHTGKTEKPNRNL